MNSALFIDTALINSKVIESLSKLPFSDSGTRRLCLHKSVDSPLHCMVVELLSTASYPPHSHSDSDEITFILRGQLEICAWFEGPDQPASSFKLSEITSSKMLYIPAHIAHSTTALGTSAIYAEVKLGPFDPSSIKFHN